MSLYKTMRKKTKCRLVKGKKETCCINPKKGHWCWSTPQGSNERSVSKNASKKLAKTMKKQCCKK